LQLVFSPQLYGLQEVSSQLNPVTFLRLPNVFFFRTIFHLQHLLLTKRQTESNQQALSCRFVGAMKVGQEATAGSVCQEDLGFAKVADDW
jgi:hypothetical protein